jgi:hypothetical protein
MIYGKENVGLAALNIFSTWIEKKEQFDRISTEYNNGGASWSP